MFHPLFGEQLPIVRYNTSGKQPQVVLQTDEGLRFVPEWMTDPGQCAQLTCGHIPQCSWQALLQLEMLLDGLDSQKQTAT